MDSRASRFAEYLQAALLAMLQPALVEQKESVPPWVSRAAGTRQHKRRRYARMTRRTR